MANQPYSADEQALFERELERKLRTELPNVREEEIKSAAQRAAERELDLHREALREELDSEVAGTTSETANDLRDEANRAAPSKLVIGLVLLILLLLILTVLNDGRLPGFGRGQATGSGAGANTTGSTAGNAIAGLLAGGTATPVGGSAAQGNAVDINGQTGRGLPNAGGVDALGSLPSIDPNINNMFVPFYLAHDGLRVFGSPISPVVNVNGRQVQWFERTRLEVWPEYAGTPYEIQSGLVGLEYTDGRDFPRQAFFPNRPGLRFFPETSHGVGGKFLDYWETHGGLDVFGYPISDEIVEILPETKRYHTVQYFQRGRLELHPEHAGTQDEVQVGLLGRALYLNEAKSTPIPPIAPTVVPLP